MCGDVDVRLTDSTNVVSSAETANTKERRACKDNKSATLTASQSIIVENGWLDGWMDRWMKNDSVADSPSTE